MNDYPKGIVPVNHVEPVPRRIRGSVAGETVFDTTRAWYVAHLVPSGTVTECPYKGITSAYWSVRVGETVYPDLAWCYDFPTRQLLPITGLVALQREGRHLSACQPGRCLDPYQQQQYDAASWRSGLPSASRTQPQTARTTRQPPRGA